MDGSPSWQVFFERRWSVLRSVDDMVLRFVNLISAAGEMEST